MLPIDLRSSCLFFLFSGRRQRLIYDLAVLVRIEFSYGKRELREQNGDRLDAGRGVQMCNTCSIKQQTRSLERINNVFVLLMHRERVSLEDVKRQLRDAKRKARDDKEFLYYPVSFRCSFNQVHV